MGDQAAVGAVQDDIAFVDCQGLNRLNKDGFIGQNGWIHAVAGSAEAHLVAVL